MINLSYNLSSILKERLQKVDFLRKEILLISLPQKTELQLRWDNIIEKTYYSLSLTDNPLTKPEIVNTLSSYAYDFKRMNKLNQQEQEIFNYKKALDYISQNWLVSQKNVSVKDVLMLYDIFCQGKLIVPTARLQEILSYTQAHEDHPIIKAGVVNIGILRLRPFSQGNGRLSRLLSYLYFYKSGYDIRGLIGFDKPWSQDKQTYFDALKISLETSSITLWLEFFSNSLIIQLESVLRKIESSSPERLSIQPSFWTLNDRQKTILSVLDQPGLTITNRKVQILFRVSQITASRDLSKLSNLGLLFSHGNGRSIYYTKV